MKMSLSSWIAARYLWSRNSGRFAPLLAATAIASIAVGVMALIVVMSVMRGFRTELADRLMGFNAHITIMRPADVELLSKEALGEVLASIDVRDVAPFVQGEVIAQSHTGGEPHAQGARVRGVDAAHLGAIQGVSFYFPEGVSGVDILDARQEGRTRKAIVGDEIVGQLLVHPDFGDELTLIAPLAEIGPTGELEPGSANFAVEGLFRAGVYDYDSKYILVSLEDARNLLGQQAEEGYFIRVPDASSVPEDVRLIKGRLPEGWRVEGIDTQNRKLFAALALERIAMGGILVMVLLIASCAIVGVIMLVTSAKRKDVAILASMGLAPRFVQRIFLINAALLGGIGSVAGLMLGLAVCFAARTWPIRLPATYYLDYLPVEIDPAVAALFAVCGCLVALLASIYPVRQASRLSVVEVLRYE
jgi:lipoprotein-releasing system permease protein